MEKVDELISRVENAIDFGLDVERFSENLLFKPRSKIWHSNILDMSGMSTKEVRILLNELVTEETNYLEIGLYKGSTFVSAMLNNNPKSSIAIDLFEDFETESGSQIYQAFLNSCKQFGVEKFTLIKNDSFKLTDNEKNKIKDINLYFYDGGHSYRDHYFALKYFYDNLSDACIFIVDDWCHPEAQYGTELGLKNLNFKIHKEWILGKSQHDKSKGLSWHNGLYIGVIEKT